MSWGSKISPHLQASVFKCKGTHAYKLDFKSGLDSKLRFAYKGSDFPTCEDVETSDGSLGAGSGQNG